MRCCAVARTSPRGVGCSRRRMRDHVAAVVGLPPPELVPGLSSAQLRSGSAREPGHAGQRSAGRAGRRPAEGRRGRARRWTGPARRPSARAGAPSANRGRSRVSRATMRDAVGVQPEQPRGRPGELPSSSSRSAAATRPLGRQPRRGVAAGPVDHEPRQRHPLLVEPLDEVRRLAQRVRLRGGDDQERRTVGLEQLRRSSGRAAGSRRTGCRRRPTNVCTSRSTCAPSDLGQRVRHHAQPGRHQPGRAAGRGQQQPDEPAVEERREPLGCVEEVQRRPRRRRVDDDQVPAAGARARRRAAGRASPSPCTPGCRRTSSTARRRTGWPGSARPSPGWPGSRPPRRRCASCRASSRRASRPPPRRRRAPAGGRCRASRCPSTAPAGGPGRW